jgi:hypothetical protein
MDIGGKLNQIDKIKEIWNCCLACWKIFIWSVIRTSETICIEDFCGCASRSSLCNDNCSGILWIERILKKNGGKIEWDESSFKNSSQIHMKILWSKETLKFYKIQHPAWSAYPWLCSLLSSLYWREDSLPLLSGAGLVVACLSTATAWLRCRRDIGPKCSSASRCPDSALFMFALRSSSSTVHGEWKSRMVQIHETNESLKINGDEQQARYVRLAVTFFSVPLTRVTCPWPTWSGSPAGRRKQERNWDGNCCWTAFNRCWNTVPR